MRNQHKALFATIMLSMGSAAMACDYPSRVDLPDGTNASKDEMVQAQKSVKTYMTQMNDYLDCIAEQTQSAKDAQEAPEITVQREAMLNKRHNAAIEEMETLAAGFNEQVRAYKGKNE